MSKLKIKLAANYRVSFIYSPKGVFTYIWRLMSVHFGPHWECYCEPQSFTITRFPWDLKNCIRLYVKCNETLQMQNSALNSRPTYSNE